MDSLSSLTARDGTARDARAATRFFSALAIVVVGYALIARPAIEYFGFLRGVVLCSGLVVASYFWRRLGVSNHVWLVLLALVFCLSMAFGRMPRESWVWQDFGAIALFALAIFSTFDHYEHSALAGKARVVVSIGLLMLLLFAYVPADVGVCCVEHH